jgi:hypothetical protein
MSTSDHSQNLGVNLDETQQLALLTLTRHVRRTKLAAMKNGFRVLDNDLHTMEPDGLW